MLIRRQPFIKMGHLHACLQHTFLLRTHRSSCTAFLPIIQISGFRVDRKCRYLCVYVFLHHNSRNLFHINAIKQKLGFFLQLKKTSRFCSPCYVNICFSAYIYFLLFIKTHEDYIVSNRLPNHKRHKKWLVLRPIKYYCSAFLLYRHIYSLRKVMLMHSMQTDNFSFGSRSLKLYTEEAP